MSINKLNFAFFGTPDVASKTLDILARSGFLPSIIITSPDRQSGRGLHIAPSVVATWADEHGIPCLKPPKIDSAFIEDFKHYNVDLSIVVAYGKILSRDLINLPSLGTINIHYSLLPRYRGASPVEQALLMGDTVTGVSIQQMEFELDTGPILQDVEVPIDPDDTKESLRAKLIQIGADMLCALMPDIIEGTLTPKAQDGTQASYTTKIKKEDGLIDINANANINYNKYRAYEGWPGVYFFKGDKRIKITKAHLGNDLFIIDKVIPEGKKEMNYADFNRSTI